MRSQSYFFSLKEISDRRLQQGPNQRSVILAPKLIIVVLDCQERHPFMKGWNSGADLSELDWSFFCLTIRFISYFEIDALSERMDVTTEKDQSFNKWKNLVS